MHRRYRLTEVQRKVLHCRKLGGSVSGDDQEGAAPAAWVEQPVAAPLPRAATSVGRPPQGPAAEPAMRTFSAPGWAGAMARLTGHPEYDGDLLMGTKGHTGSGCSAAASSSAGQAAVVAGNLEAAPPLQRAPESGAAVQEEPPDASPLPLLRRGVTPPATSCVVAGRPAPESLGPAVTAEAHASVDDDRPGGSESVLMRGRTLERLERQDSYLSESATPPLIRSKGSGSIPSSLSSAAQSSAAHSSLAASMPAQPTPPTHSESPLALHRDELEPAPMLVRADAARWRRHGPVRESRQYSPALSPLSLNSPAPAPNSAWKSTGSGTSAGPVPSGPANNSTPYAAAAAIPVGLRPAPKSWAECSPIPPGTGHHIPWLQPGLEERKQPLGDWGYTAALRSVGQGSGYGGAPRPYNSMDGAEVINLTEASAQVGGARG